MLRRTFLAVLFLSLTLPLLAQPAHRASLQLNWFPEVEHGGFYAAPMTGMISLEIVPGGPEVPVIPAVAQGKVDFGVLNADEVLLARAQGARIVALMAPMQISPRCLMVHEESGMKTFEDIKDTTLAMSARSPFAHFLQKKYPFENVQVVPYNGNVAAFIADKKFAQQGYVFSEPYVAKKNGANPHVLMVSDVGFNPYTSLLVCREELLTENPDLVRTMTMASVRGWESYLKDPVRTNAKIQELNPEMDAEILAFGADAIKLLCQPEGLPAEQFCKMTDERWQTLHDQMLELNLFEKGSVNPAEAFTNKFME